MKLRKYGNLPVIVICHKNRKEISALSSLYKMKPCPCGSGKSSSWQVDARGISLCRTCPYGFVYIDQESFDAHPPASFAGLVSAFREYQGD